METLYALLIGLGLSAACGFRVFLPLLVMGIAHQAGHLTLAQNLEWIGSWPAITAFGAATALEIGAYYVPWIDNLLDTLATPAAFVAGTLASAATLGSVTGMSPLMQWSVAAIAGGGTATVVQGGTVLLRAASSLTTGGTANPVVSTTEAGSSTLMAILAIALPLAAGFLLLALALLTVAFLVRRRHTRQVRPAQSPQPTPITPDPGPAATP